MMDYSLFDNHAKIVGNPRVIEGLSYGLLGGNIAMLTDGDEDYFIGVEGSRKAGTITNLGASGFSICTVIAPRSLQSRVGGDTIPSLFQKIDSDLYGYTAKLLEDGDVYFEVKVNGQTTKLETTSTPLANPAVVFKDFYDLDFEEADYDAGARYDIVPGFHIIWWISDGASPPNLEVYVNNVDESLSGGSLSNQLPTTDTHDTLLGVGTAGASQFYKGIYQDYRFMKRQVTPTEIDNHFENKISISNIPFGDVFVIGAARFNT